MANSMKSLKENQQDIYLFMLEKFTRKQFEENKDYFFVVKLLKRRDTFISAYLELFQPITNLI